MTPLTASRRQLRAPVVVAAAIAGLVFLLGACSGGSDDSADGGDGGAEPAAGEAPLAERNDAQSETDGSSAFDESDGNADMAQTGSNPATPTTPVAQRAVISTATVSMTSDDVADARFDVGKIVDQMGGEIAEEQTEGGEEMRRSRVVIRVPSERFSEAVAALEKVGTLESSTRKSEDVTTRVIDNAARIRAQEESLRRVEVLLGRATSIRDIVAIESQLTRRQADLDSLKSQQAFLADQTSLSTIAVHIERAKTPAEQKEEEKDADETGFLSGLEDGWNALTTFGSGLATVVGAVLPFAIVLGLLGVPTWVLVRRFGRRRPSSPAAPAGT
ncbi:MAG: DUF4349 domain-containing protein [Actinomycetota bacterium]|nr:DUF4349 domain-containing protein [Actinomycetota bacterium]